MSIESSSPWRHLTGGAPLAAAIVALYDQRGGQRYDEVVTQTEHAVQCAELARHAGADDATVCAALLHDIGHLVLGDQEHSSPNAQRDLHHEDIGARFLSPWFGPAVTEPIRLHVAAKRYLCRVAPGYAAGLSPASVASLVKQGGAMTSSEADTFATRPAGAVATELRRWDDAAKVAGRTSPTVAAYTNLLADLTAARR